VIDISCLCTTFGRTRLLAEAVKSFHRQQYGGRLQLVILNDHPHQIIRYDHPDVMVINRAERFETMGEKRHFSVEAAEYDWVMCWDDDDICLPHRVSRMVRCLDNQQADAIIERSAYWCRFTEDYIKYKPTLSLAGTVLTSKDFYYRCGGYKKMNSGQDTELNKAMRSMGSFQHTNSPADPQYIYRWATHTYHLSGYGRDRPGHRSGYEIIGSNTLDKCAVGDEPVGDVIVQPHWKWDYEARAAAALAPPTRRQ